MFVSAVGSALMSKCNHNLDDIDEGFDVAVESSFDSK